MKNKVKYIIVHSTKTRITEPTYEFPFHYIIYRNGELTGGREFVNEEEAIHLAYEGGVDHRRRVKDTRTEAQCESLFLVLFMLTVIYSKAKIVGANQIFGESSDPGFKVGDWLNSYTPNFFKTA